MKACNECPFYRKNKLEGSPEWLKDILWFNRTNPDFSHTCHKTDPKADGYVGGKTRECVGHITMMMNRYDGTPGRGGVYTSVKSLARRYMGLYARELKRRGLV